MSGNTVNKGFPYPLTPDFADVQDAYRLATAVDEAVRAEQAPFRSFLSRPSWLVRQTVNGSGFLSGTSSFNSGAIDWDNTGGWTLGTSGWQQPVSQPPSWWMFGCTLLTTPISGTPVVGDMNMARIRVTTTDQVSGVATSTNYYQRNDETNTGGEWINLFTMAAVYRASATLALILNGSTSKALGAGTAFWGLCLGPVT